MMNYQMPAQITVDNLDEVTGQYARRTADADSAANQILAIRAVGRSTRGLVEVTVDGSALLVDLQFSPGAPASFVSLGGALKQAHDRAVAEWNRQVRAITDETLRDDPQMREHIQITSDADFAAHVNRDNLEDDDDR